MDHKIKMMIVDAITNIVKNAPTMKYDGLYNDVTQEAFNSWITYVESVINIISEYININKIFLLKNQIQIIEGQQYNYNMKISSICNILLEFARYVLKI